MTGKTIRKVVLETLEAHSECIYSDHYPNKETVKSLKNIERGKSLTEIKNLEVFAKKLSSLKGGIE